VPTLSEPKNRRDLHGRALFTGRNYRRELSPAARLASNPEWSTQDPQRPQSIWWHTDATKVGFRIVRPLNEQANLKGLKSQVVKGKTTR